MKVERNKVFDGMSVSRLNPLAISKVIRIVAMNFHIRNVLARSRAEKLDPD